MLDLGGPAPGGWHQVHDLKVVFERAGDGATVELPLARHVAGFHAWYRMRGGMISVLPNSFYFNLDAGEWSVSLVGDGGAETATVLDWAGPAGEPMFRLTSPARATFRDLNLNVPNGVGILVEKCDQPGGRSFADQVMVNGGYAGHRGGDDEPRVRRRLEAQLRRRLAHGLDGHRTLAAE